MEILEQLYHLNFQGFKHDIDKYLAITEDTTNNVNDWKLFELFSKLILSNHLQTFGPNIVQLNPGSLKPYIAIEFVLDKPFLKTLSGVLSLLLKIRKDIIITSFRSHENREQQSKSMYNDYAQLASYLNPANNSFNFVVQDQFKHFSKHVYSLLDLLIYSNLNKSRSYNRILINVSENNLENLLPLKKWYQNFYSNFSEIIKFEVDPNYLPRKEKKQKINQDICKYYNEEFFQTVTDDNLQKFSEMLSNKENLKSKEPRDKLNIHHYVCAFGKLHFCQVLAKHTNDWEIEDNDKMSPLFHAISSNNLELIKYLVSDLKVNIEHCDIQKRSPFYYACSLGDINTVKLLKQHGADINAGTFLGRTPFSKSCFLGQRIIVEYLLTFPELNKAYPDFQGRSALHNAVFGPKGGRDGKKIGTWSQDSPEIVQILLEHGMDVEILDKDDNTPLHIAASSEALDSIPLLIAFGADINKKNKWGETPMMVAAKFGHINALRTFYEQYNGDLYQKNKEKQNILYVSARTEQFEIYEYLLIEFKDYIKKKSFKLTNQQKENKYVDLLIQIIDQLEIQDFKGFISCILSLKDENVQIKLLKYLQLSDIQENDLLDYTLQGELKQKTKQKKLTIFLKLVESYGQEDEIKINLNKSLIELLLQLDDKLLLQLLFDINLNWINYISINQETFLFKVVEKRRSGITLSILDCFSLILQNKVIPHKNKWLQNFQNVQSYIYMQNKYNQNILDLCITHTYLDLYQIIKTFTQKHFDKQLITQDYYIPKLQFILQTLQEPKHKYYDLINQLNQEIDQKQPQINHFDELFTKLPQLQINPNKTFYSEIFLTKNIQNYFENWIQKKKIVIVNDQNTLNQFIKLDEYILGVDLEHCIYKEDNNSHGYISTIQISTSHTDYIIDCFYVEIQQIKYIFESTQYLKIMHGSETDLKVLFTHLKISCVNVFDTARLQMEIENSKQNPSLQTLCQKYLGIKLNKEYQTSDWRIRPLPQQMIDYARQDAAVLLLLFPLLIQQLINEKRVLNIIQEMNKACYKNIQKSKLVLLDLYRITDPSQVQEDDKAYQTKKEDLQQSDKLQQ